MNGFNNTGANATNGNGISNSDIVFSSANGDVWQSNHTGYFGATGNEFLSNNNQETLTFLNNNVNTFGLDLRAYTGYAESVTATVYGAGASILDISTINLNGNGVATLFGFTSAAPITSVNIAVSSGYFWDAIIAGG